MSVDTVTNILVVTQIETRDINIQRIQIFAMITFISKFAFLVEEQ